MLGVVSEQQRVDLLVADVRFQKLAIVRGRRPECAEQERDDEQRRAVDDDCCALGVLAPERVGNEPGRERQEGDRHQQQQVDAHEPVVQVLQALEDAVVCEPEPSDRDEARRVAQIGGPLIPDAGPQVVELGLRNVDVEDEQRDGDREDAVAERLRSPRGPPVAHGCRFDVGQGRSFPACVAARP